MKALTMSVGATAVILYLMLGAGKSLVISDCQSRTTQIEKYQLKVFHGVCYYFFPYKRVQYVTAENSCERVAGTLAIIKDKVTNNFVWQTLKNDYRQKADAWIGLSDVVQERSYLWADGSRLEFSNWGYGEGPHSNISLSDEDCVTIDPDLKGTWRDRRCGTYFFDDRKPFVCERRQTTDTATGPATTTETPMTPRPTCPPFVCTLDCGMDGYLYDDNGCSVCSCDV